MQTKLKLKPTYVWHYIYCPRFNKKTKLHLGFVCALAAHTGAVTCNNAAVYVTKLFFMDYMKYTLLTLVAWAFIMNLSASLLQPVSVCVWWVCTQAGNRHRWVIRLRATAADWVTGGGDTIDELFFMGRSLTHTPTPCNTPNLSVSYAENMQQMYLWWVEKKCWKATIIYQYRGWVSSLFITEWHPGLCLPL